MKSHLTEDLLPAELTYHTRTADGTYAPTLHTFVTESMLHEIENERRSILASIVPSQQARQRRLFDRFDPTAQYHHHQRLLAQYGRASSRPMP